MSRFWKRIPAKVLTLNKYAKRVRKLLFGYILVAFYSLSKGKKRADQLQSFRNHFNNE